MAKIECEVEEVDVEKENGGTQPGVKVTCSECGECTESFGTTERSINRCLVLLKESCPNNANNFYVAG